MMILTWIPTFAGDTIAIFRKGHDGKTSWEREQGRKWAGDSQEFGERFFMKEAKERASRAVKRDWEPRLVEARYLGQHARTGAMMGITAADGIVCGRLGRRLPEAERWDQTAWQDLKGVPWNLRPTAQPGAAEAERRKRGRPEPVRARDETQQGGVREKRAKFDEASSAPASRADANEDDGIQTKRTRGKDTRGREFHVTKKDVERFGSIARCPACADTKKGISGRHAHNDECPDRIGKLLMDEGAQRVESYFERARIREETGSGGTATSSGSTTVVTHAQIPKRKADERSKRRQTAGAARTPVPTVHVGGSSDSGGIGHGVSITTTEQRVVVPPEVPQDTRKCIEDMEISQFEVKK